MKKIFIGLLVFLGLFVLVGCAKEEKKEESKMDYLVLVNKKTKLPDDWEEKLELVSTKNAWNEDIQVEKEAFEHYKELKEDVEKDL